MGRERFLAELAAELGRPRQVAAPARDYQSPAPLLSDLPPSELSACFARELEAVGGEVMLARTAEEARARLATELGPARLVVSWTPSELFRSSGLDVSSLWQELGARCLEPEAADTSSAADREAHRAAALSADVGVTGADLAIADSGTLVLAAGVGRPRTASLLARLHIALVSEQSLVPRLGVGLTRWGRSMPSALQFITGPSRTSDIENDLSIGVHGPARVLAIVVPRGRG